MIRNAGAVDESDALALRNLAAALFRLEKSWAPQDLRIWGGAGGMAENAGIDP